MGMRSGCSLVAVAMSIVLSSVAHAQDAQAEQEETAPGADPESDAPESEIIVTAQFRDERLQDTPIAISAFSGETLERKGASDIADAANLAPNVQLSSGAGNFGGVAAVFIRGVGQADPYPALEPGVGMYIDDVYYGVLAGSMLDLMDVERVEVLRGPQGTLAGKNSLGGAIKIFSKRPGPNSDAFVEAGFGSRNSVLLRGGSNFTLQEGALYARVSFGAKHSDGYVDRLDYGCVTGDLTFGTARQGIDCKIGEQGGQRVYSVRGSLLWEPNGTIENFLTVDATRDRSQNLAIKTIFQFPAWTGGRDFTTGPKSYTNYEDYIVRPTGGSAAGIPYSMPDTTPIDAWGIANNLRINLSDTLSLTSITGYRKTETVLSTVVDGTPASILDQIWRLDHEQFTQELRLNGEIGTLLDWTLGGFYYYATGVSTVRVNIAGGVQLGGGGVNLDLLTYDPVKTESRSVFAHTVTHLTDSLDIIAALRYTDDAKDYTFNRLDPNGSPHPVLGSLLDVTIPYRGDRLDYRFGVNYRWSDTFMTYGQISTGYKGGGVNPRPYSIFQAVTFEPEDLIAYEIGFKSQFADRRVTLNMAAFRNDYANFQAFLTRCPASLPPVTPCALSTNVGDARVTGVEAELFAEPVDDLIFDASIGYLDFEYKSVDPATGITLDMTNIYTPKWTASGGIQYGIDLGPTGVLTPRVDLSYRSRVEPEAVNDPLSSLEPRTLVNAQLTWQSEDDDWQVQVSAKNLTDKFYYTSKFARALPPYFSAVGILGAPRTFMFTIKRRFD